MIVSESIQIERSATDIFEYFADFTKHHEFIGLLESCSIVTKGDFGLGSQFIEIGEMLMGGTLRMKSEVTRYEHNSRLTCISIDGGNQIEQDFQITELSAESCKVTFTTTVTPPKSLFGMASRMASGLLKPQVEEQMRQDARTFKEVLERTV